MVCDFAETYHIYDWRALPLQYAATLACGLRDTSRIKMALSGQKVDFLTLLTASILDDVQTLVWMNSKDGAKGRNRPESIVQKLIQSAEEETRSDFGFDSAAAFEAARASILGGGHDGEHDC